jgi:hypothetical protein
MPHRLRADAGRAHVTKSVGAEEFTIITLGTYFNPGHQTIGAPCRHVAVWWSEPLVSARAIPNIATTTNSLPATPRWELATKETGSATAKSDLATSKNTPATP